jgi:MFS family permease
LAESQTEKHDPFVALRQTGFQLYTLSRVTATLAQAMLQAVMAWQVYDITESELSLGLLGFVRFFPSLGMSLVGGAVADAYDRRIVMVIAKTVPIGCAVVLGMASIGGWIGLELILGTAVLLALAGSFENPARVALLPAVVRPESFENAVTVSNTFQKLAMVTGPTVGGIVLEVSGEATGYFAFCALTLVSIPPLLMLRYVNAPRERQPLSLASIKEGVNFVLKREVLLGVMALDMFAVIFGGAQALLPVYASDILHVGPAGYGVLSSAMQIGAFATALALVVRPPVTRTGRALVYTVIAYGLLTVLFGISREYMLSILLYALIGAADQVSVVMRQTTVQMATPDELRGRVSSVNQVFVGASNQIGGMRAGFVAAVTSAEFAVVSGGFGAALVAVLIAWKLRQLYDYEVPRAPRAELTVAAVVDEEEAAVALAGDGNGVKPKAETAELTPRS